MSYHVPVKNENYGYAVATYGDYVVVSNPAITRFDPLTASVYYTGSVDLFRYNKARDEHDYVATLWKSWGEMDVDLITEANNSVSASEDIAAESLTLYYNGHVINIDKDLYTASIEDGFGMSLDMYNKYLIIGSPYSTQITRTSASFLTKSLSSVEIYDLARIEFTAISASASVFEIQDPDELAFLGMTSSFGTSVSINGDWAAVGSPYASGSRGMVYLYRNQTVGTNYSWSLYQRITASSNDPSPEFGVDVKLNKYDGPHSYSLVVGCGDLSASAAYYFEYVGNQWSQSFVFPPEYATRSMTFSPEYDPYQLVMPTANGFGRAVSIYGDTVIVGEPFDRNFYEFSGSTLYQQGSVYIFERCDNLDYVKFRQVLKTYGTPTTLYNNRMGWSVDMWGLNAVAGIPKIDFNTMTSCYVAGTLEQLHYCNADLQNLLQGQMMLLQKNTSSNEWEVTNVFQKKKKYLTPYRVYGYDVSIADQAIVVGAPMLFSDSNRNINFAVTESADVVLDDLTGKAYIYLLHNLRDEFHVGNAFYRNGKIIIMTSGSIFDGLFYNPINTYTYEYDLQFKSEHTIHEKQIVCTVAPGEFNVSTNPTAIIKNTSSFDINRNGVFDYQDADVILRYMQYKNTSILGIPVSTDWSSSVVVLADEISLLNYYQTQTFPEDTGFLTSASIVQWETTDTQMQTVLDLNQDNRIDIRDMNIMWKYFTNRLTQENYASYITPACRRKLFSQVMDYLNDLSKRYSKPLINPQFLDYEREVMFDKTGSFLSPMTTTIGLYSGLDLVAVAKLGTPIKITPELPINFVVKMDF